MFRLARRLVSLVVVAALTYAAVMAAQVIAASRRDERRRVDAIVVLGAAQYNCHPSAVLRARLDHAAALWRAGFADRIVVTGGRRVGDQCTEAAASAGYLTDKGVPDASILREVSGRSSWQSLAASAAFLEGQNRRRVLLVSDPFHAARIKAMAGELGLQAWTSPTRTSPIHGASAWPYFGKEVAAVSVGRLIGFRRLVGVERRVDRVRGHAAPRYRERTRSGVV